MAIESEIYSRLSGFAGLTALVSTRIYPGMAIQGVAEPYVVFFEVSAGRPAAMGPTYGLARARFQFTAFGKDRSGVSGVDEARDVVEQLKAALDPWTTSTGIIVQGTMFLGEGPHIHDEGSGTDQLSVDYEINYEE